MKTHPYYTQQRLARELRELNQHYDGPGACVVDRRGVIMFDPEHAHDPVRHYEEIPGDGRPFDHVGAARRILAAWRDAPPPPSGQPRGGYHD